MAKRVAKQLRQRGARVIMTRNTDKLVYLAKIPKVAEDNPQTCLFRSILIRHPNQTRPQAIRRTSIIKIMGRMTLLATLMLSYHYR